MLFCLQCTGQDLRACADEETSVLRNTSGDGLGNSDQVGISLDNMVLGRSDRRFETNN